LDPGSVNGLNLYAYCGNNPVMNSDPSGCFWDTVFDVLSVGWSAYEFKKNRTWANFGWLILDVVCALIPFVPGISKVFKAGSAIDNLVDAGRTIDNAQDAIVIGNGVQRVIGKADEIGAIYYHGYDGLQAFNDMVKLGEGAFVPIGVKLVGRVDNAKWLFNAVHAGNAIVDVGRDGRSLYKFVTSAYSMERTLLFLWQYGKIGGHLISVGGKLYDYYY